jgi:hypothetical protein
MSEGDTKTPLSSPERRGESMKRSILDLLKENDWVMDVLALAASIAISLYIPSVPIMKEMPTIVVSISVGLNVWAMTYALTNFKSELKKYRSRRRGEVN